MRSWAKDGEQEWELDKLNLEPDADERRRLKADGVERMRFDERK